MYIKIRVFPDSKKEEIKEIKEDTFEVKVKMPAKQGLANDRVREILANHFSLPTNKVHLISGHQCQSKIFSLDL